MESFTLHCEGAASAGSSLATNRPLTLAQAAALLPGPIGVPEELLRFVFYGNVEGVPDVWVEQIAHRKHLRGRTESVSFGCAAAASATHKGEQKNK